MFKGIQDWRILSPGLKALANQTRVEQLKKGGKRSQRTSNRLMKHHQNESSPLSTLISAALTDITGTPKDAVCGIDKQGQVGCLILFIIIAVLLIETCLSPCCCRSGVRYLIGDPRSRSYFFPVPCIPFCRCPRGERQLLHLQCTLQNAQTFLHVHTRLCTFSMHCVFLIQLPSISPRTQQLFRMIKALRISHMKALSTVLRCFDLKMN